MMVLLTKTHPSSSLRSMYADLALIACIFCNASLTLIIHSVHLVIHAEIVTDTHPLSILLKHFTSAYNAPINAKPPYPPPGTRGALPIMRCKGLSPGAILFDKPRPGKYPGMTIEHNNNCNTLVYIQTAMIIY